MGRIPGLRDCVRLLEEQGVPPHIRRHSERVALVAVFLARDLREAGVELDLELVCAGALLHDITKHRSLETGENHAATARRLLEGLGYPEVAEVVGNHIVVPLRDGDPAEDELVYYADKRVKHETVVSVSERFKDLLARYGKTEEAAARIKELEGLTRLVEQRIFARLSYGPEALNELNKVKEPLKCLTEWLYFAAGSHRNGKCL